jgi:hypothetical protein
MAYAGKMLALRSAAPNCLAGSEASERRRFFLFAFGSGAS